MRMRLVLYRQLAKWNGVQRFVELANMSAADRLLAILN